MDGCETVRVRHHLPPPTSTRTHSQSLTHRLTVHRSLFTAHSFPGTELACRYCVRVRRRCLVPLFGVVVRQSPSVVRCRCRRSLLVSLSVVCWCVVMLSSSSSSSSSLSSSSSSSSSHHLSSSFFSCWCVASVLELRSEH